MTRVVFGLLVGTASLSQATVLPAFGPLEVLPNLVLVLLLVWSALRGVSEGLIWVFGTGVLLDLLAMDPLGTNGLALLVVAILGGGPARRRFFHSGMIFPIVLAVIATVVHTLFLAALRDGGAAAPRLFALQALLNVLLVPPLYLIAGWMDRWMVEARP